MQRTRTEAEAFFAATFALGQKATEPVIRISPEQLKWVDEPDGPGFRQTVVAGDPSKPGIYVVHVRFPPGVMSRPHTHREDRYATVIKGKWYMGEGTEFAPDKTVPLKPEVSCRKNLSPLTGLDPPVQIETTAFRGCCPTVVDITCERPPAASGSRPPYKGDIN